jgi:hypothetical protein
VATPDEVTLGTGVKITVTPQDLADRRAFFTLDGEAKVKLAHLAGAPWSDKDPDATLHDLQVECLSRPEREKIIHGASRLGKSVLGGAEVLIEAMIPFSKTAIVAARYDHVSHEFQYVYRGMRELFKNFPQAFKRLIYRHSQNYHDYECSTIWGSMTRGYSTDSDDGAALLGQEFTRVVLGEGSHITQDILEKKIMRAIDGALMKRADGYERETGYLSIYTTPKGFEGCSAAEWERVQKQTARAPHKLHYGTVSFPESVWIREANILENPGYDRRVFEARKRSLSKAAFEEQYEGKMTFASGRIFAEYNEETHHRPLPSHAQIRDMRLGVGFDTGAYFGAVLVGVDRMHQAWVLGEVFTQKQTIDESCIEVRNMIIEILGPAFACDDFEALANRIDLWTVDPASQHKMEIMDRLDDIGLCTPTRGEGKFDLLPTIETTRTFFAERRLFINDDLTWLPDQIKKYIWKVQKTVGSKNAPTVKEPRKSYDHVIDALRFIIVPLMDLGPLDELPAPVTTKDAWERAQRERVFGPLNRAMAWGEEIRTGRR